MSLYEFLTVVLAGAALVVSYRTAKRQTALEQTQAKLAEAQHKALARDQEARLRADVRARILKLGRRIEFKNHGHAPARNVRVASAVPGEDPPILGEDLASTFPLPELKPGEGVTLHALVYISTRLPFPIIVTWDDDFGSNRQQEIALRIDDAAP